MSRRVTIRTIHDDAERLARAIEPDNTDEMKTTVEAGTVVTHIERETTSGLRATVDDYVVNLDVAETVTGQATDAKEQYGMDTGVQHATDANQRTTSTDDGPSDTTINDNE